jgi:putative ABC transport system substrate-binding protein
LLDWCIFDALAASPAVPSYIETTTRGRVHMDRRAFITMAGGLLATPLAAEAQQAGKVYRIGFISPASSSPMAARDEAFRQGLRALGYILGQNITIEYRWADGKNERLTGFAAELVNLKLDIIVTHGGEATRAVQQVTTTIPIVIAAADDPLASGLVASLARPGGNITGLSILTPDLTGKRLELLKALLPGLTRVAVLWNPGNPISEPELRKAEAAAAPLGLQLQSLGLRDPREFASAFSSMKRERADALFLLSDAMFFGRRKEIADLAASNRLPLVAHLREFADAGGLMTYGPNVLELHRRAATYVDKILKGAKPGDLPVEQPTKFDLVINLKTAKALGLTIPPSLLQRADQVVE